MRWEQERYAAAHDELVAEVVAHKDWKLDIPTLCQIHDRAVGGETLRKTSLSAGRHYHIFPEPEEISSLLDRSFACLRMSHIHPVLAATLAHLDILMIHPFRDGNGRTARLIATLVLVRAGFRSSLFTSVEQHHNLLPATYIEALDQFDLAQICHGSCVARLIYAMAANSSLVSWFRERRMRIINALGELQAPRHQAYGILRDFETGQYGSIWSKKAHSFLRARGEEPWHRIRQTIDDQTNRALNHQIDRLRDEEQDDGIDTTRAEFCLENL